MKRIKNRPIDSLFQYIEDNKIEEIQKLIATDKEVLTQAHKGHTPLNYAMSQQQTNFEAIKFLIDNSKDLLKNGFNTNLYKIALKRDGLETIKYLVENIPFYKVDDSGKITEYDKTLFDQFVWVKDEKKDELLLKRELRFNDELLRKAKLQLEDEFGQKAKLLFGKINFAENSDATNNIYSYIVSEFSNNRRDGAYVLIQTLFNSPGITADKVVKDNKTPIMLAIEKHDMYFFYFLINNTTFDPNITNAEGNSALMIVTKQPISQGFFHKFFSNYTSYCENTIEIINKLLQRGADTNLVDAGGNTPLMMAIMNHNLVIFNLLIDRTNLAIKSKGENTALTLVIKNFLRNELRTEDKKSKTEIRKLMLEKILTCDLDFNVVDSRGDTCLMMAITYHNEEVFNLLVNKTNLNLKNNKGENALMLAAKLSTNNDHSALGTKMFKSLLIHGANLPENSEITILTSDENLQNLIKDVEKAKLTLKDKCAKENIDNNQIISLIQYYLENEFKADDDSNNSRVTTLIIELIVANDLDFNTPDVDGNTCLMLAIKHRNIEIFELLINKTDLELRNFSGENALSLAVNLCNSDEYLTYAIKMLKEILIHGVEIPEDFYTNIEIQNNEVKNLLISAKAATLLLENVYNEVEIKDAEVFYERFKYFLNKNGLIIDGKEIDSQFYINKLEKNSGVSELLKEKIFELFLIKSTKESELFYIHCQENKKQKMLIENIEDSVQKTDADIKTTEVKIETAKTEKELKIEDEAPIPLTLENHVVENVGDLSPEET